MTARRSIRRKPALTSANPYPPPDLLVPSGELNGSAEAYRWVEARHPEIDWTAFLAPEWHPGLDGRTTTAADIINALCRCQERP